MFLRFFAGKFAADFELYGAQAESVTGLYDALRSAIIDVTADAVVLRASSDSCIKVMAESASPDAKAVHDQIAGAIVFATQTVEVYLSLTNDPSSPRTLLYTFADGLGEIADQLAKEVNRWAKEMQTHHQISPAALAFMSGLCTEFDPSVLPSTMPGISDGPGVRFDPKAVIAAGGALDGNSKRKKA